MCVTRFHDSNCMPTCSNNFALEETRTSIKRGKEGREAAGGYGVVDGGCGGILKNSFGMNGFPIARLYHPGGREGIERTLRSKRRGP